MSDEKNHYGGSIAVAAGVLLAIYFLFPAVFVVPILAALHHNWISEPLAEKITTVVLAPPGFLADRFPVYDRMLWAEYTFCERHGMFSVL